MLMASVLVAISAAPALGNTPDIIVNGRKLPGSGAFIQNGTTYVPLRTVSEAFGASVNWDGDARVVNIAHDGARGGTSVSELVRAVSPSVVAIVGNDGGADAGQDRLGGGMAHGAGVIIKSGGDILTNAHVVDGLRNIVVILHDGSAYSGRIRYIDRDSDLAVVKIDKIGLPILTFADMRDVMAGDTVIAIGTPLSFSLRNSASQGIVSGINRGLSSDYALIQTDAAINPGNSGGPLINMNGQIVGINSSKFAGVGVEGIGFAIPADTVEYVLRQFEQHGEVRRANISAMLEEGWAARRGLPTKEGLRVKASSGQAHNDGLRTDDVIMSVGGQKVHSTVDFNECMKLYSKGDRVDFVVRRGAAELTLKLTLT